MRRPVSTPFGDFDGDVLLEAVVAVGVVGDAVLPAAPEDAGPGASEGADRAWVVVPAAAGAGVVVFSPGVPFAGCVGEGRGGVSESVVAAVSEARDFFAAGLDRDGGHAGVGGEVLGGGVAGAVIADLGQVRRTGFDGDCFSWFPLVGGGQILVLERPAGSSRRLTGWARS
jgi:hypothetical protein